MYSTISHHGRTTLPRERHALRATRDRCPSAPPPPSPSHREIARATSIPRQDTSSWRQARVQPHLTTASSERNPSRHKSRIAQGRGQGVTRAQVPEAKELRTLSEGALRRRTRTRTRTGTQSVARWGRASKRRNTRASSSALAHAATNASPALAQLPTARHTPNPTALHHLRQDKTAETTWISCGLQPREAGERAGTDVGRGPVSENEDACAWRWCLPHSACGPDRRDTGQDDATRLLLDCNSDRREKRAGAQNSRLWRRRRRRCGQGEGADENDEACSMMLGHATLHAALLHRVRREKWGGMRGADSRWGGRTGNDGDGADAPCRIPTYVSVSATRHRPERVGRENPPCGPSMARVDSAKTCTWRIPRRALARGHSSGGSVDVAKTGEGGRERRSGQHGAAFSLKRVARRELAMREEGVCDQGEDTREGQAHMARNERIPCGRGRVDVVAKTGVNMAKTKDVRHLAVVRAASYRRTPETNATEGVRSLQLNAATDFRCRVSGWETETEADGTQRSVSRWVIESRMHPEHQGNGVHTSTRRRRRRYLGRRRLSAGVGSKPRTYW
ncbi:hypothetical protein C8J57DRAFT_1459470 [Mycena rebaudengoi]|nr:hypothetical protein C8J57DRAFT_1459470 [Mycena rebaudengoi]